MEGKRELWKQCEQRRYLRGLREGDERKRKWKGYWSEGGSDREAGEGRESEGWRKSYSYVFSLFNQDIFASVWRRNIPSNAPLPTNQHCEINLQCFVAVLHRSVSFRAILRNLRPRSMGNNRNGFESCLCLVSRTAFNIGCPVKVIWGESLAQGPTHIRVGKIYRLWVINEQRLAPWPGLKNSINL